MASLGDRVRELDWVLAAAVFSLVALGLVVLGSLSTTAPYPYFSRQVWWAALGAVGFFAAAFFDYRILRSHGGMLLFAYGLFVGSLVLLLLIGREVRGVVSWFRFGSYGIEPGEFMKVVLIFILAKYFSRRHVEIYRLRNLVVSGLYAGIPVLLVFLQPDFGTALILGSIWLGIVLSSGIKKRHLAIFLVLLLVISVVGWQFVLRPFQRERLISFVQPSADLLGAGYNANQAKIAVGSGGWWGRGLGYGSQTHLHFLPEASTDFIFAAVGEELGFVGIVVMLSLFGVVFWRLIAIGLRAENNFARLTVFGIVVVLFVHLLIHAGMNMKLLPITGITLPFVSYGGSSLLVSMILVGVAESIALRTFRGGHLD